MKLDLYSLFYWIEVYGGNRIFQLHTSCNVNEYILMDKKISQIFPGKELKTSLVVRLAWSVVDLFWSDYRMHRHIG